MEWIAASLALPPLSWCALVLAAWRLRRRSTGWGGAARLTSMIVLICMLTQGAWIVFAASMSTMFFAMAEMGAWVWWRWLIMVGLIAMTGSCVGLASWLVVRMRTRGRAVVVRQCGWVALTFAATAAVSAAVYGNVLPWIVWQFFGPSMLFALVAVGIIFWLPPSLRTSGCLTTSHCGDFRDGLSVNQGGDGHAAKCS